MTRRGDAADAAVLRCDGDEGCGTDWRLLTRSHTTAAGAVIDSVNRTHRHRSCQRIKISAALIMSDILD